MNTTAETNTSTVAELIEAGYYIPPVIMKWDKDGSARYVPVSFEKDSVQYDVTMSQEKYPDGNLGRTWVHITPDKSQNEINSRFEILDL
jgi:hypothetical protein